MSEIEKKANVNRPPIVTVMGHVDHGKTSLLDAIAKTDVAAKETGGITQGISAFSVTYEGKKITFVDTPGHEAFLAMRKRGGQVADIILLVVAGTEGVKPQTQEAIAHLKESKALPIVVITKMDLPGADPEKVKRQLSDNGILTEGLGGQIPVAQVSVKDEESLKKLLDLILLLVDLNGLPGSDSENLEGVVIESLVDRKRGPLALVAVRAGCITLGQDIYTASVSARVRSLLSGGAPLSQLSAGEAGWVMGFSKVPKVGEIILSGKIPLSTAAATPALGRQTPQTVEQNPQSVNLKMVLKVDSSGSLEALEESLKTLLSGTGKIEVVASGVGDINDGDVYLAKDSGAVVIGFKVRTLGSAADLAREREVEIQTYNIIYKLLEDVSLGLSGLNQWKKKTSKPKATVAKIFELPSGDLVLGCKIEDGTLRLGQNIVVRRGGEELFKSAVKNLKIGKESVEKASAGSECGLMLSAKDVSQVVPGDEISVI